MGGRRGGCRRIASKCFSETILWGRFFSFLGFRLAHYVVSTVSKRSFPDM